MCRNIRTLFNFEPPATELEIRDASLQFVRKLSGFTVPSKANEPAVEANFSRCFQLMECDDARLLQQWVLQWRGAGVTFEFIAVVPSAQTREVVAPHLA